ncbi:MAG TPA: translation elongation factor Ts [Steroidobacteraceae bacterium]|nr:translation elongation factor Ts [Steroidobacteraceae bacterium]
MSISAQTVAQLRERTGAGMMECKKALLETAGDLDAAAELMRKQGLAKADKKAARVAAEGVIAVEAAADGKSAAMVEVNCETDFVAREADFRGFATDVARTALAMKSSDAAALLQGKLPGGEVVDEKRRALVAKIGENISVRRAVSLASVGVVGAYAHGTRIGAIVALEGGDAALARDLAMHVAASNPRFLDAGAVPADELARERGIAVEQARLDPKNAGKPENVLAQIIEGKVRKVYSEQTLMTQPFVKDDKQTVEKLLKAAGAKLVAFQRFEVGAGIEKKQEDFVAEVMAQVSAAGSKS